MHAFYENTCSYIAYCLQKVLLYEKIYCISEFFILQNTLTMQYKHFALSSSGMNHTLGCGAKGTRKYPWIWAKIWYCQVYFGVFVPYWPLAAAFLVPYSATKILLCMAGPKLGCICIIALVLPPREMVEDREHPPKNMFFLSCRNENRQNETGLSCLFSHLGQT